uniref:Uncharacterized protein n=1 Tax=Haptolina ericina TaxID=156174 RepID=A0A7S3FKZ2_9EUKA
MPRKIPTVIESVISLSPPLPPPLAPHHTCIPQDASLEAGPEGDLLRAAMLRGCTLPRAMLLGLLFRALKSRAIPGAEAAEGGLLVLECPSHMALLPSLLLHSPCPMLLLLLESSDQLCLRRMRRLQRHVRSSALHGMPKDAALQSIQAHRATDERVARAFGAAFPGRLCVIDAQVTSEEVPAVLCGALHAAHRAKVWKGARDSNEPPILLFGSESVVARLVTEMATHWGLVAIDAVSLMGIVGEEASAEKTSVDPNTNSSEDSHAAGDERMTSLARQIESAFEANAARGERSLVSCSGRAVEPALQAIVLAVKQWATSRPSWGDFPTKGDDICIAFLARSAVSKDTGTDGVTMPSGLFEREDYTTGIQIGVSAVCGEGMQTSCKARHGRAKGADTCCDDDPSMAHYAHECAVLRAAAVSWVTLLPGFIELETLAHVAQSLAQRAFGITHNQEHMEATPDSLLDTESSVAASSEYAAPGVSSHGMRWVSSDAAKASHSTPSFAVPLMGKTSLISRGARGVVIFSAAVAMQAATSGGGSICAQVADRLGAAHLALPALLRGQLNLPQSPRVSGDVVGSMCDASLSDAIRAGKLVSGAPALQVLQTAVHAAPQLLILIEHTRLDGPLDLLVSRLRPHLVILQQAPAEEGGQQSRAVVQESNGGTTSHGPETRRAYELKVLRALGEAAPPIQLCSGGIEEASALIREHLTREAEVEDEDEEDEVSTEDTDSSFMAAYHAWGVLPCSV